jgi:hypothetical protein
MLRHVTLAALLPLSLAACGSGTETQSAAVNNAADGNYLARMAQLNEKEQRRAVPRDQRRRARMPGGDAIGGGTGDAGQSGVGCDLR